MKIATYWARRSCTADDPDGYPVTRTVLRGSDISLADAEHQAKVACDQICQNIRAGFEPDWYEYERQSKPEPIDREWLGDQGSRSAAITINRFGLPVLNTAELVIVDVDVHGPSDPIHVIRGVRQSILSRFLGRKVGNAVEIVVQTEEDFLSLLRVWVAENETRSARVYRTAHGLRYILPGSPLAPDSTDAQSLMVRLGADPLYARLCEQQRSYRARLAPKPWRIGCKAVRRDALNDDVSYKEDAEFQKFIEVSKSFAVCELIEELGPSTRDAQVADLIRVHDEACKVGSGLPLA